MATIARLIDVDGNRVDIVYGQHEVVPIEERKDGFLQKFLFSKSNKGYNFGKKKISNVSGLLDLLTL